MDINDYLNIANKYKNDNNKNEDFVVMGLYKLIQETGLYAIHAHTLLSQQGDDSFGLLSHQINPHTDGLRTLSKFSKLRFHQSDTLYYNTVDIKNDTLITDTIFGFDSDHDLLTRFNNDIQRIDSLFELKDVYSFDEITRIKQLIAPSASMNLAFELISQNDESSQIGKFNDAQYSYNLQIDRAEGLNVHKNPNFDQFTGDALYDLIKLKNEFPLTPESFINKMNSTAQSKLLNMAGFSMLAFDGGFNEEEIQKLIDTKSPFITDTFLGDLFKLGSLRDVVISYFDHQELDAIKLECELRTERFQEHPSIEHMLANDPAFSGVDDLLLEVYSSHPELQSSHQDIKIITDKEIAAKNETIEHHVDRFHFFEDYKGISDLGPNRETRRGFLEKYKLYGDDLLSNDGQIKFISSNQFSADAILSAREIKEEKKHNELTITGCAINPLLSDKLIGDLLNSVVDYAQKHKQIITFQNFDVSNWGGINKDRLHKIVTDCIEENKDKVPFVTDFGKDYDRYHLAIYRLTKFDVPYENLPKTLNKMKKLIDLLPDHEDLDVELELDLFASKEKLKMTQKISSRQ
jgi:hypothetical protein